MQGKLSHNVYTIHIRLLAHEILLVLFLEFAIAESDREPSEPFTFNGSENYGSASGSLENDIMHFADLFFCLGLIKCNGGTYFLW